MQFSIGTAPFYIPTNSAQGFQFLHIFTNMLFSGFLIVAILIRVRWYFIMVLICISLIISDIELSLSLFIIHISSLERYLYYLPIIKLGKVSFYYSIVFLNQIHNLKYFLTFLRFSFPFFGDILWNTKFFNW